MGTNVHACCFRLLWTPSLRTGCCYFVCRCQLFHALGAGLGVASLSNCIRSPFWEITRWVQSPGSVAFVILFARIAILDPALWIIVFNLLHFGRASNTLSNVLSEEPCNHHVVSLPPGHFQKDSLVLHCLSSFVILFSSRGTTPLPKMDWEVYEIPLCKIDSFQLYGSNVYSLISGLIGAPQDCPWIDRRQQRDFLLSKQYSGLTAAFLNQMNPILVKGFFRLCLNSLSAHRELSHLCATCRLWRAPAASLCGILRLRDSLLASFNTTTQQCATSWCLVRGKCTRSTRR